MVNKEHYARLREGVQVWNDWRANNLKIIPDLKGAKFNGTYLSGVNLSGADLSGADLGRANLGRANLSWANLSKADLSKADLSGVNLSWANLSKADLSGVNLSGANLGKANLSGVNLSGVNLGKANLSGVNLSGADLSGVNLSGVNLSGFDLSGFDLSKADLNKANLRKANLSGVNLSGADFSGTDLSKANLSGANLSGTNLSGTNLSKANLSGVNLSGTNLSGTNLSGFDLSGLDLSRANLNMANLSKTQALGTEFTDAKFTGACLEDWNINSATKLNNIDCQYVYLKSNEQERRPSSRDFAPGEFSKVIQKALNTVDLFFTDGIDWKAFLLAFQELQAEYGEENLSVQAIEKKSGGAFVIRLEVPPEANKADIESQAKALYEIQLKALEARYHAELQAKDEQIITHRQHNASLENIINMLGSRPIENIITVTANAENNSVSETFNNNFNQPNIANFANKNQDDARQQANQNIYQSQQNQNLDGTKKEIQQLLNQLAQTNPTTDVVTEAIHQKIKTDPTFKARLLAALKAGGLEALKAIFNHPAFSIPLETIKGYLEAE
ncbi:pentapeptide repeat-containing protein [Nostoc sp. LEGE 12450]|uniref:pentapeptide repeat-containing protein n=1 Tax=Nostoc sp. LEGE 12450 TaxID=1828643 RepID=UPI0018829768|nr:pentapeptide repeat-containing protein [Nostoc sp. LEGE 12450]MBE8988802.1 pentapeptide repeat-containing protein [Nostoc sp. LEGE 12450]